MRKLRPGRPVEPIGGPECDFYNQPGLFGPPSYAC